MPTPPAGLKSTQPLAQPGKPYGCVSQDGLAHYQKAFAQHSKSETSLAAESNGNNHASETQELTRVGTDSMGLQQARTVSRSNKIKPSSEREPSGESSPGGTQPDHQPSALPRADCIYSDSGALNGMDQLKGFLNEFLAEFGNRSRGDARPVLTRLDESELRRILREELRGAFEFLPGAVVPNQATRAATGESSQPKPNGIIVDRSDNARPEPFQPRGKTGLVITSPSSGDPSTDANHTPNTPSATGESLRHLMVGVEQHRQTGYRQYLTGLDEDNLAKLTASIQPWAGSFIAQVEENMRRKEPSRDSIVATWVESAYFDILVALVIIANALFQLACTNWKMRNLGEPMPLGFLVAEYTFIFAYLIELLMKIYVHRWYFFWGNEMYWNHFDLILILISFFDLFSEAAGTRSPSVSFLRSLKFMKLGKLLRIVRLMHLIRDLRLILNSMMGSLTSFVWSMVTLSIVFFVFGILFVEGVEACLVENCGDMDPEWRESINNNFGSVQAAMEAMFKATTGGEDWSVYHSALLPIGRSYGLLYLFFIAFCNLAFMNILTGIFMENAMTLAQPDRESMALEHRKEEVVQVKALSDLFKELDADGSGRMDKHEFLKVIQNNIEVKAFFHAQGLDIQDAEMFYRMLVSEDESTVEIDSFVDGCMKMKGGAKSLDIQSLGFQLRHMRVAQHKYYRKLSERLSALEHGGVHMV